jgi:hypothetical protein
LTVRNASTGGEHVTIGPIESWFFQDQEGECDPLLGVIIDEETIYLGEPRTDFRRQIMEIKTKLVLMKAIVRVLEQDGNLSIIQLMEQMSNNNIDGYLLLDPCIGPSCMEFLFKHDEEHDTSFTETQTIIDLLNYLFT